MATGTTYRERVCVCVCKYSAPMVRSHPLLVNYVWRYTQGQKTYSYPLNAAWSGCLVDYRKASFSTLAIVYELPDALMKVTTETWFRYPVGKDGGRTSWSGPEGPMGWSLSSSFCCCYSSYRIRVRFIIVDNMLRLSLNMTRCDSGQKKKSESLSPKPNPSPTGWVQVGVMGHSAISEVRLGL